VAEIMHSWIPGAERVEIAGAGHMSPLTHRQQTVELLEKHLASVAGAPA